MTTKETVEKVLSERPETRDNDRLLLLHVWEEQGLVLTPEQKHVFKNIASSETIRRTRQLLQESGEYEASENVSSARRDLETETRSKIKNNQADISWMK